LKSDRLAVVRDDAFVVISDALVQDGSLPRGASMIDLMTRYPSLAGKIDQLAASGPKVPLDMSQLIAPVPKPSKVWAAASNYRRGGTGIGDRAGRGETTETSAEELLQMAFLKPPSAIIGPEQAVIIPDDVEGVYPELELCAIIGQEARDVPIERAMDAVFGYTVILDMTARSKAAIAAPGGLIATRNVRKGYETFAPIGPWIATKEDIPNPQGLLAQLWVNGELTQSATTAAMINGVAELVSYLSGISTLYPGDLIATGNPDSPQFQRSLEPGDVMKAEIENIGVLNLNVVAKRR
jgi:2-keto-4-pentenoate hydratase/2-oxohepta-3-ene-1,7-dioic acid hydratase in catechol pathway